MLLISGFHRVEKR